MSEEDEASHNRPAAAFVASFLMDGGQRSRMSREQGADPGPGGVAGPSWTFWEPLGSSRTFRDLPGPSGVL